MSYTPEVNADTLTLLLGLCATGRATASSTTLDMISFGTVYNPRPGITMTPADVGMPIAIVGGGPVDGDMPPVYFVQGATFVTTIAAYVSPTEVTLAAAPDTSIFNTGFATVILFRPCPFASDVASGVPTQFQFKSSIAPGTNDTLQFSVLNSLGAVHNPYIDRFGAIQLGQPVYLVSSDPAVGDIFGGYIDTLTTSSYPSVSAPFCWSASCASWTGLARRRVVPPANPQTFEGVAGDVVFRKLVLDYLSDDGVAVTTSTAPDITLAAPVGANIGQLLDQVVSLMSDETTQWYWTTDAWRNFILAERTATSAPWNITGGSDLLAGNTPYQQSITQTHNQMANFVYAIGQNTLLNTLNATINGNGTAVTFNLPEPVGAAPTITLNSGPQTVGVLGVDTGKNWYWSQGSAVLTQDSGGAVLVSTDVLLVTYTPETLAVAQAPNTGSLQSLQAIEGTSATYQHSITTSQPILPADLLAIATAYETEYGEPASTCQLYTLRPGLKTGQLQSIDLAAAGIPSGDYLIATVQMTLMGGNVLMWQYTAFGGANIGDSLTPLVQFINRQTVGGVQMVTPSVPITAAPASSALIQKADNSPTAPTSVAFPSSVTAGNLLVAIASASGLASMADPPATSDTLGSTWTQAGVQASMPGFPNPVILSVLYAIAPASGSCTVTVAGVGGLIIAEFSGVDTLSPLDVVAVLSSSTTPPVLTTTKDKDLIIVALAGNTSSQSVTPPETFLDFVNNFSKDSGVNTSWEVQSTAGAFTTSMTNSGPATALWVVVGFAKSTGTTPPAQTTDVVANPSGTVSNSGALTADLPVFGAGGTVIKVGTKQGSTDKGQMASGSPGSTGAPLLYDASGNAVAGTTGQLVPPGGSTNQVLAKNSATSGDTAWVNPGGGGGGNSITYGTFGSLPGSGTTMGDMYVCTDSPYTFIWSGTAWLPFLPGAGEITLPPTSGWTWDTQGGSSVVTTYGNLYVSFAGFGSDDARAYYRAVSGPFTMKMLCKIATWKTTSAQSGVGIAISDGTKYLFFGGFDFTGQSVLPRVLVQYWSTITNPVATLAQLVDYSSAGPAGGIGLWLGCVVDSTHITFYISIDGGGAPGSGANWIQVYQEALAAHLGTIVRAGVGGYLNTASDLNVISLSGI